ncbi:MAG: hypothetical protein ACI89J_003783 [Hyphomicrobiaceae bacterium]|jgi:hypothetical protein
MFACHCKAASGHLPPVAVRRSRQLDTQKLPVLEQIVTPAEVPPKAAEHRLAGRGQQETFGTSGVPQSWAQVSSGLCLRHAELSDHCIAHAELLNFARYSHREIRNETDNPRHLVVCDLAVAKGPYISLGEFFAGT